jgi:hypothetical protein
MAPISEAIVSVLDKGNGVSVSKCILNNLSELFVSIMHDSVSY